MRITSQMIVDNALRNIEQSFQRLSRLQGQLSSGKRITKSSDDPAGTSRALSYKSAQSALNKYQDNTNNALGWTQMSDSTLGDVSAALTKAREIAVQASNGTLTDDDRMQLVGEVQQLFDQVLQAGNNKIDNRYIFAGHKTTTEPFTAGGASGYTYNGDAGQIASEIEPGSMLVMNVPGSQGISAALDALWSLRNALGSGDQTSVGTSIQQLGSAQDAVLQDQGSMGGRVNRLETTQARLKSTQETTAHLLSNTEDADITSVITDLAAQQNAYQAALIAASRSVPQSLVNYMQ
ncbi:MAG: flagellar hook-associated protein 3 [Chloroflexota bacterium]|nr:MAG: flagellar hook-associated protein 3 [Chloroflexota bacterium]